MNTGLVTFNGISGADGRYLLPPMAPEDLGRIALGQPWKHEHLEDLRSRHQETPSTWALRPDRDNQKLSEAGWGVIFPADADPSGVYWGALSGKFYACQGNTLVGRQVIVAMAEAYEQTQGSLADRLMAALVAADCAGGDHRGRLAAGVRVAKTGHEGYWLELYVDESDDAVSDLLKKYVEMEHAAKGDWTRQKSPDPCPQDEPPPVGPSP